MKKTFLVLLILFISILYLGCNKDENPVTNGNSGTPTTTTNTYVKTTPYVYMNVGLNRDSIIVSSSGTINSLTFALDTITDIDARQLEIFLVHNNIVDTLVYQLPNAGSNFIGTVFSDAAQNSINTGSGNYTGTFKPYRPLSIFNGHNISGQWYLIINKFTNDRTGVIKSWGITISYNPIQPSSQWVQVSDGTNMVGIQSLTALGSNIFAGTSMNSTGLYLSTNNGTNWTRIAFPGASVYSLAVSGNNIFAGLANSNGFSGIHLSTNNGTNWTQVGLNDYSVECIAIESSNIYAGTYQGVYRSSNNGTSWIQTSLNNKSIYSLAVSGNNVFAGTDSSVYYSSNNGTNWIQTNLNNKWVRSLLISGNKIFAGEMTFPGGGVYLSTNNGINWIFCGLNDHQVNSLIINNNIIFAGTNRGVYLSTDNGVNWIQKNQGLPLGTESINTLLIANNYIFAGGMYHLYRRDLSEIIGK